MKEQKQKITEIQINPTNTFVGVDALVGLPPLQLNEIYNDDSFKLIERVPAKTVDLILEDMPYNTTACEWDVKIDLELYWKTRLRILKPTGLLCLTASQPFTTELVASNMKMFRYEIIWEKSRMTDFFQSKFKPMKSHENILIFYNALPTYNPIKWKISDRFIDRRTKIVEHTETGQFKGNKKRHKIDDGWRNPCSIISIESVNTEATQHSTEKPVGLFEYLIRTYTNEGDLVFDGFGGSGTTAIAAHKSKRNFIVIEKEKKYFDLAKRRLENERAQLTML